MSQNTNKYYKNKSGKFELSYLVYVYFLNTQTLKIILSTHKSGILPGFIR